MAQPSQLPNGANPLALTLGRPSSSPAKQSPAKPRRRPIRKRPRSSDDETILPPYPWATDRPCRLHPLEYLERNGLVSITGKVNCKKCDHTYEMEFDLRSKFGRIASYFLIAKEEMRDRAPEAWTKPALPDCRHCGGKNAVRPEMGKKERMNWLFLFLGEMIGCCKHEHLKHFLDKNGRFRTGAKDRLVYLVYMSICMQLDPNAPFDR